MTADVGSSPDHHRQGCFQGAAPREFCGHAKVVEYAIEPLRGMSPGVHNEHEAGVGNEHDRGLMVPVMLLVVSASAVSTSNTMITDAVSLHEREPCLAQPWGQEATRVATPAGLSTQDSHSLATPVPSP